MSRPLRIEYEGAVYHVTARGNSGQNVYTDNHDRNRFLDFLAAEIAQQRWLCHAYVLMGTHWHLLLETPEPNLSQGMRRLNGRYTQWFNHRHRRHGHLLQGRYQAILVEKESYLLELCRYVVLNPVRAKMVKRVDQWPWSSYAATAGSGSCPCWLTTDWVLGHFENRRKPAQAAYRRLVAEGRHGVSPWHDLRGQMFLGSEAFLRQMGARIEGMGTDSKQISQAVLVPNRPTPPQIIETVAKTFGLEKEGLFNRKLHKEAFQLGVYLLRRVGNVPLKEVAAIAGISCTRVSQIQKCFEKVDAPRLLSPPTQALLKMYKVQR